MAIRREKVGDKSMSKMRIHELAKELGKTNKEIFKLKPTSINDVESMVNFILASDEEIKFAFTSMRDKLVFTNKRVLSVNVQGITGREVDYTSIPYTKIQAFSIETSGTFDISSKVEITVIGLGSVIFELTPQTDIKLLGRCLSEYIL